MFYSIYFKWLSVTLNNYEHEFNNMLFLIAEVQQLWDNHKKCWASTAHWWYVSGNKVLLVLITNLGFFRIEKWLKQSLFDSIEQNSMACQCKHINYK